MSKFQINPLMFFLACEELAEKVKRSGVRYCGIVTIERGGLPIATIMSHKLDLPIVEILQIKSYSDYNNKKTDIKFNQRFNLSVSAREKNRYLIVDDISDTGDTLESVKSKFVKVDTLALYYKLGTKVIPDYYSREFHKKIWVSFPWEYQIFDNKTKNGSKAPEH